MRQEEKGKLQLIYEEGYEEGWNDGYDAAVRYLVSDEAVYKRAKKDLCADGFREV